MFAHFLANHLLVEDDLALGNLTSELLASVGYRVLQPQSTDEALQIALHGREPIHLLLTDVIMPKMNGVELWSRIKEANPKMRVIFISGYAGETLAQQIALVPDLALLEKPVSRDLLLKRVHEVLHNGDLPKQSCA